MAYFGYRGYKCYYEEHGKADNPLVVIVPDEGDCALTLFSFEEVLADSGLYRVVIPDFLGTGKSDQPNLTFSDQYSERAEQLRELFIQNGYERAVLIALGESGSRTVSEFLSETPDFAEKIIVEARYAELFNENENILVLWDNVSKRKFVSWQGYALMCLQMLKGICEKCPYCGSMMSCGNIRGYRYPATWTLEDVNTMTSPEGGDWFELRETREKNGDLKKLLSSRLSLETNVSKAFVCRKCGKMIADVNHLIKDGEWL